MIQFENLCQETPYLIFKEKYEESLKAKQKNIEAISISSYSNEKKEVNARYVNLKFINERKFIFFSNYLSPKSKEFKNHNQITVLIYWNSTNTQIRMKALIEKTSKDFNQKYFSQRNKKKNALAICSDQSRPIDSYESLQNKFDFSLKNNDLNGAIQIMYNIYDYGYSVIDIFDYLFSYIKTTDNLNDDTKYKITTLLCKYITIFNIIHEDCIELALFTGNMFELIQN